MGLATLTLCALLTVTAQRTGKGYSGPVCLVIVCQPRIDNENYKLLIVLLDMNLVTQSFMLLEICFAFRPIIEIAPTESTL